MSSQPLHPLPPFTLETAKQKVKAAQDKWNTRDPKLVSPAYTPDSVWRNRDQFFTGREAIEKFLTDKWAKEHNYRLRKELFAFQDNKMCFAPWTLPDENELTRSAVEFWYEYSDEAGERWYRTYGLEHWCFAEDGRMKSRQMSGNTIEIGSEDRWFAGDVDVNAGEVPAGHISRP